MQNIFITFRSWVQRVLTLYTSNYIFYLFPLFSTNTNNRMARPRLWIFQFHCNRNTWFHISAKTASNIPRRMFLLWHIQFRFKSLIRKNFRQHFIVQALGWKDSFKAMCRNNALYFTRSKIPILSILSTEIIEKVDKCHLCASDSLAVLHHIGKRFYTQRNSERRNSICWSSNVVVLLFLA